jgi:hypothetical protein
MAWRSSFGATALLALVALHSSTLIELASSEQLTENRERLEQTDISPTAEPVRLTLEKMLGLDQIETEDGTMKTKGTPLWTSMLDLWQQDETNCGDDFLATLDRWYGLLYPRVGNEVWNAIRNWKDTCYSRLEDEIQSELKAMSESTREQFKLFVKQDRRDFRSKYKSFAVSSPPLNSAIGKLRRLIGSPDDTAKASQRKLVESFVSACKEMAASRSIIRANYASKTPRSSPYFPHIRFYDDCRRLLDLFTGEEQIEDSFRRNDWVETFGEKLDEILVDGSSKADPETKWSETVESDGERERSVAKAAYQFAKTSMGTIEEEWLNILNEQCSEAVAGADDTIWLHLHLNLLRRKVSDQQILVIKRYSRYLEACKQLGKLEKEQIIKKATEKRGYNLPKLSTCFGCSSAKTNRR